MARVVVGMSGGVDSSVAAALLKYQGHDVIGIMLRLWSEPGDTGEDAPAQHENKCCSLESMSDARNVAAQLDIPFYVLNVEEPFQHHIVDFFYDEYTAGRTPNPCLRCNRFIRFTLLLERARAFGAEYLATGHYVRLEHDASTGDKRLMRGISDEKDQSYVLHVLSQEQLQHAMFPLGDYSKPVVRKMAEEFGLPVARKAESQEICFVASNDYRGFMRRYATATGRPLPQPGEVVSENGTVLGRHNGLPFYTVGQRKGLGIAAREPLHVLKLDTTTNQVIVGPAARLDRNAFCVRDLTFTSTRPPTSPFAAEVKVRYKATPVPAVVTVLDGGHAEIALEHPLRAITPGQAAVFYCRERPDVVLGGGIITEPAA